MSSYKKTNLRLWAFISPLVLALVIWKGLALGLAACNQVSFPGPGEVLAEFWRLLSGQENLLGYPLGSHIASSLALWAGGYGAGLALGLLLGLMMVVVPALEAALAPLVFFIHLVPGLAWIPVVVLVVGIGPATTVLLIALTAFPPVTVSLVDGIRAVPQEFIMVSGMCGDSPLQRFFRVQLPSTLPHLMSGLRLALANSWRVVVAAEMVVGSGIGLGYTIIQSRWTMNYGSAFVCIGIIAFFGLVVEYGLFRPLEEATIRRWRGGA